MRLFTTETNRNNTRVSKEFLKDIVEHKENYVGLPLYVDTKRLKAKQTRRLDHRYNADTDEFETEMIGSFYDFEIEDMNGDGSVLGLIGKVKIAKRNRELVETLANMFAEGGMNVSFEIAVEEAKQENGETIVDKSDKNKLIGMAIVSVPACEKAKTLQLVASVDTEILRKALESKIRREDFEILTVYGQEWAIVLIDDEIEIAYLELQGNEINIKGMEKMDKILEEKKAMEDALKEKDELKDKQEEKEQETEPKETEKAEEKPENTLEENLDDKAEEEKKEETLEEDDDREELGELKKRIEKLESLIEKQNEKVEKAESEVKNLKQEKLRNIAKKMGLNVEDEEIAKIIEEMDFEKLLEKINKEDEEDNQDVKIASYADMRVSGEYGGLLERIGDK